MSREIEERLRAGRPPHLDVSPADERARRAALGALRTATRGRRRRLVGAAATGVSLAAIAAVLALLLIASPSDTKDGTDAGTPVARSESTSFGVLNRTAGPDDALPAWVARDVAVGPLNGVDPRTARRAFARAGRLYFLARGSGLRGAPAAKTVCLIDAVAKTPGAGYRPGNPGGVACAPTSVFGTHFLAVRAGAPGRGAVGGFDYAGVVGDGFTLAEAGGKRTAVIRNAFVLRGVRVGAPITISGPAGTRTVVVDNAFSPTPSVAFVELRASSSRSNAAGTPRAYTLSGRVSPGYTTVSAGGKTTAVNEGHYMLRDVPSPPFETISLVARGPRGTASYEYFLGPQFWRSVLRPYRRG